MREALIKVQIGVVKAVKHCLLHTTIQVSQVADHASDRIYLTAYRYLDNIVMAVAVGIAALAVDGPIFFLAILVRVQAVRCTEDIPARQISSHASP
jgi:hypothetical protein